MDRDAGERERWICRSADDVKQAAELLIRDPDAVGVSFTIAPRSGRSTLLIAFACTAT